MFVVFVGADDYSLWFSSVRHNALIGGKIARAIESFRQLIGLIQYRDTFNSVESIYALVAIGRIAGQHIPSILEKFHTIWIYRKGGAALLERFIAYQITVKL